MSSNLGRNLTLAGASVLLSFALAEGACRVYALRIYDRWQSVQDDPAHYFRASKNPVLAYELLPDTALDQDGRKLFINRYGIRAVGDEVARDRRRVAILGDSVVFGNGLSQEVTLPQLVQERLDPSRQRFQVLNFGVPGYGFPEIAENLRLKDAIYDVDEVVFLQNANDFARRDSVYEGADNGLYRMYRRPAWTSLWFIRKVLYRMQKEGEPTSVRWYRWFFAGNEQWGYESIAKMKRYADEHGIEFSVVLLPAGRAYQEGGYELAEQHARITAFLDANEIGFLDPIEEFGRDPARYFDDTDHLSVPGNRLMTRLMAELIETSTPGPRETILDYSTGVVEADESSGSLAAETWLTFQIRR